MIRKRTKNEKTVLFHSSVLFDFLDLRTAEIEKAYKSVRFIFLVIL